MLQQQKSYCVGIAIALIEVTALILHNNGSCGSLVPVAKKFYEKRFPKITREIESNLKGLATSLEPM